MGVAEKLVWVGTLDALPFCAHVMLEGSVSASTSGILLPFSLCAPAFCSITRAEPNLHAYLEAPQGLCNPNFAEGSEGWDPICVSNSLHPTLLPPKSHVCPFNMDSDINHIISTLCRWLQHALQHIRRNSCVQGMQSILLGYLFCCKH